MSSVCNSASFTGTVSSIGEKLSLANGVSTITMMLNVKRLSGNVDSLLVVFEDDSWRGILPDDYVQVKGSIYTSRKEDEKTLLVFVLASSVLKIEHREEDENLIDFHGLLGEEKFKKTTKQNKLVVSCMLSATGFHRKHYCYVPCVCWGSVAHNIYYLPKDTLVHAIGRMQSRTFEKNDVHYLVHEISINKIVEEEYGV